MMHNKIIINDDIITKYLCGEASPEEAISLESWKEASVQNQHYFDNLEQTFLLVSGGEKIIPNKEIVWQNINKNPMVISKNHWWKYGIAAVFLTGLLAMLVLIKTDDSSTEIYATQNAVNRTLNDRSTIYLEKNSHVSLDEEYGKTNRSLSLSGKAKFTVTHDENKPFIIDTKGVFIEDLGTVFTVESWPESDTVYVVVNEGIVKLYDELGSELIIKAGEKAWYIRSQKKIVTNIDTVVMKFDFKDTKLSEVVRLISETYDTNIHLQPNSIGECLITTQFFDEEIATIITVISETLGFKYEYQDHLYIITGKPCTK